MKEDRMWSSRPGQELKHLRGREGRQDSGSVYRREKVIGVGGRRRRALIVGVTGPKGGISGDPAAMIALRIRGALMRPPNPPATIYDAQGNAIATMDPLTRKRTPIS